MTELENDWWDDDNFEVSDRINAMQNEIERLRELCELLKEQNQSLKQTISSIIRPKGKSWLTVDLEGNLATRDTISGAGDEI
jgi:hypothetical protein